MHRGLAAHRNKSAFYSALAHEGNDRSGAREGPDLTHVLLAHFDCVWRRWRGDREKQGGQGLPPYSRREAKEARARGQQLGYGKWPVSGYTLQGKR